MARHIWSLLCKRWLVDPNAPNSLFIADVLDGITVDRSTPNEDLSKPTMINFACKLISTWVRDDPDAPEQGVARIGLILPDGERTSFSEPITLNMQDLRRSRTFVNIDVLPFKGSGTYEFTVEVLIPPKWHEIVRLPLDVVLAGDPAAHSVPPA